MTSIDSSIDSLAFTSLIVKDTRRTVFTIIPIISGTRLQWYTPRARTWLCVVDAILRAR